MKVVDHSKLHGPFPTTLLAIPERQVFRGTLVGQDGHKTTGVFFKAESGFSARQSAGPNPRREHRDCVVVQLDAPPGNLYRANVWLWDRAVHNYEPLNVELVIKGHL